MQSSTLIQIYNEFYFIFFHFLMINIINLYLSKLASLRLKSLLPTLAKLAALGILVQAKTQIASNHRPQRKRKIVQRVEKIKQ